ncbi:hypothetical protein ACIHQR_10645 [Corallococcus coralloides]|uniref:hypothetical protein n=1 Tax=Corallococcus coralloides TaxID=184914 RepID=UPI00384E484F
MLADGVTASSTGNTQTLMKQPHARGAPLTDEASAKFTATLDIAEPRRKTSTFEAELSVQQQGAYEVTVTAYDPVTGTTGVDSTTFIVEG